MARVCPVGMVEYIQEFRLQAELPPFAKRNDLGKRKVVIREMRTVKPRVVSQYAWRDLLADVGEMGVAGARPLAANCRVDGVLERTGCIENANCVLQLGYGDAVKRQATVPVVVEGAVAPRQLKGKARFVCSDGSERPPADHSINRAGAVEKCFAVSKGEIKRPTAMDDVSQIVSGGPVTLPEVANGKHVHESSPLGVRL